MKRFAALLLCLLPLLADAAPTKFWRCEGTTLDGTHDLAGNDGSATANNTPTIVAGSAKVGTNGLRFDGSAERYSFDSADAIISPTVGSIGFWLRVDTWASSQVPFSVRGSTGSSNSFSIEQTSLAAGDFRFHVLSTAGAGTTITTAGADHVEDTWYFIKLMWDSAAPLLRIETYTESGGTLTLHASAEQLTSWTAPADLTLSDGLRLGDGSGSGGVFDIDNFWAADDDAEPLEDYALYTSYTEYGVGGGSVAPHAMHYLKLRSKQ